MYTICISNIQIWMNIRPKLDTKTIQLGTLKTPVTKT